MRNPDKEPEDALRIRWKKIFIALCLCAALVDPLFLYIPILQDDFKCLMLDPKLKIAVLLLRSVIDYFYVMDIIIRIYRSEKYLGVIKEHNSRHHQMNFNSVLKMGAPRIAKIIWESNDILIDIVALLPLPQVAILIFFSKMSDLRSLTTTRMVFMNIFALLQFMPRVLRIYLSSMELKKIYEQDISDTPIWIKGVLNFFLYIIASHIVGAMWYFFAIQRMMMCWHSACRKNDGCDSRFFGCHDHHAFRNTTILNDLCSVNVSDNSSDTVLFNFGIFATVLQYGVVGSTNYFQKFLNCFWWGLRNLSSFGSNLQPSVDGWENLCTVFISITGILLFLYLIGNMQMYMQLESIRTENRMQIKRKMKGKDEEIESWFSKNGIPTRLINEFRLEIMEKIKQAVQDDTDANLDDILPLLPSFQSRIKDLMPLPKLKQVPMLGGMDDGLLRRIYEQLEPVKYKQNDLIIRKGEPVDKMVYIVDGDVSIEEGSSNDSGRGGAGEFCGQELLCWPFYFDFPCIQALLATKSVKAISVVEGLALNASDLKSIYMESHIKEKEKHRHRRMIKEEIERNIDGLIRRNGIPEKLNKDVKRRIMEKLFQEYRDVYWNILDWDYIVSHLPLDFQDEIKSYMPLTKLKETFPYMDKSVLKEICCHLWPKKYNHTDNIIQKGDPIQMLLIVEGRIGHEGYVKGAGEFYGEELLHWPFSTSFPDTVPIAAESLSVITDVVEVLVLTAKDMTSVATEFRKHFIKNYDIFLQNLRKATFSGFFTEEEVKRATRN